MGPKSKISMMLIILLIAQILLPTLISKSSNSDSIEFTDENFKNALIAQGVDINGDGQISQKEAESITQLAIFGKNIQNISGIEYFKNINYIDMANNYISDISQLENLNSLTYVAMHGNKLNCSPLRSYDEKTISTINLLQDKGVTIFGIYDQIVEHNSQLAQKSPIYKVLFVYVNDIDANVKKDGETINYKHTLTEGEIEYFNAFQNLFEKCVEKLSDYAVNIQTSTYVTKQTINEYGIGYDMTDKVYMLEASDIEEIQTFANEYDTIFVCSIYDDEKVHHTATGLGGIATHLDNAYGQSMVYFNNNDVNAIENVKEERLDARVYAGIHEFIHSLENYGTYMGAQIWEWHSAETYYNVNSAYAQNSITNVVSAVDYLKGASNPSGDGTTGIIQDLYEITSSELVGKDIVINKSNLELNVGNTEKLYATAKKINPSNDDAARWSNSGMIWRTTNENIATVDEFGNVTAVSQGQCNIIVTDSTQTYSEECTVEVINESITEKLEINLKTYEEKQEGTIKYINNINPETTISKALENITTNGEVQIYKGTTQITDLNTNIATGMTLKISLNNEKVEYTVVVTGDLNGDGQMGDIDVLRMARYKAGLDNSLSGAYLQAANIYKDNNYSDDIDLLKMVRVLVGLDEL